MARGAGATRPPSRSRPALAVAVSLACFALTGTWAASATAKRGHPRPAPAAPVSTSPAASVPATSPPASTPAAQAPSASAPASPAPGGSAATTSPRTSTRRATGRSAGCCTSRRHAGPAGQAKQRSGGPGRRANTATEQPQPAAELAPAAASRHRGAGAPEARTHRAHGSGHRGGAGEARGKRSTGTPRHAAGSGAAKITTTFAAPASVAPVSPAPLLAPAVVPPRIVAEAPAKATGSRVARPARRTHVARRARTGLGPAAAALAPVVALAPATSPAATPTATTPPKPHPHQTQSQLVTTVTRIIGVIPTLVWAVIGALAALAIMLGAASRLAARRARWLARQRRDLLEDVGLLQAALLPVLPGRLGPVGTSAAYLPASGPGAGGDFYDVFALADGELAVIVGDVSGHGRKALPHTTLLRFTLRAYLEAGLSPRGALQAAAPVLERQLGDSFATVVLATYNPRDRVLVYSCAGHPPPVLAGSDTIVPLIAGSSPPIGAGQPTGRRQTVISVPGEALACFYTDGVTEARVGAGLFGVERLRRTVAELGPDATAAALVERVAESSEKHPDDMAACMLRVEGGTDAPRVLVEEMELGRRDLISGRAERFLLGAGVHRDHVGELLRRVHAALGRHGGVVLELHLGDGAPEAVLREQNVAQLRAPVLGTADRPRRAADAVV